MRQQPEFGRELWKFSVKAIVSLETLKIHTRFLKVASSKTQTG